MFFGRIISCACDLHLKLNILNTLNIIFLSNGLKIKPFPLYVPFRSKFQDFDILYDLFFNKFIVEHVRTPFNEIIKFNTDLVYPTHTHHGHPAWI
jgi:hypothetical protein